MRTVYLFLLALLSVLCWSCYDDQGNYDYHELNRTAVSGIDPVYRWDRKRSILFRGRKIWIGSFGQVREFIGLFSNIAISRPVL